MILLTSPSKPVEFTAKGLPRRPMLLALYAQEIDDLYAELGDSQGKSYSLSSWDKESVYGVVRKAVHDAMKVEQPVDDEVDIFSYGADRQVRCSLYMFEH